MPHPNSPEQDPVLTAWQNQIQAIKNPWLLKMFLQQWQRILKRLTYFYAQLASLPRRNRRALQRALATSLIGAAMLLALSSAPIVHAATITVDPGASGINPGDGCSLVEAIHNANNDAATYAECVAGSGADTITLPTNATLTYTVSYGGSVALPAVVSDITIDGNGTTIERDSGAPSFGIMGIDPGGNLTLNDATLTGGQSTVIFGGGGILNFQGTLTVNDSTITGNVGFFGGGISAIGGPTNVNRSSIDNNYAYVSGGILQVYAPLIVTYSTISNNQSLLAGGGLLNAFGTSALNLSTVSGNASPVGGGLFNYFEPGAPSASTQNTVLYVYQSMVSGNYAIFGAGISNNAYINYFGPSPINGGPTVQKGGVLKPLREAYQAHKGLGALADAKLQVTLDVQKLKHQNLKQSIVTGNAKGIARAHARDGSRKSAAPSSAHKPKLNLQHPGAPTAGYYGVVAVDHSTVNGNVAYYDGGGVSNSYAYSRMYLTNSTVSGNSAQGTAVNHGYGGGVDNYGGSFASLNSTITENYAATYGGGISNEESTAPAPYGAPGFMYLSRTLVTGNRAGKGGNEVDNYNAGYSSNDYNLFGDSGETTAQAFDPFTPGVNDLTATSDGTNPKPLGGILIPTLANNGGPTLTHNLLVGSPALDKAPNAECSAPPIAGVDQRNISRNVDIDGSPTPNDCDIGSIELQNTTAVNVGGLGATVNAKGKVEVKWRTLSESQIAGFNVWREVGNGKWKQLNKHLKQAKHAGAVQGAKYQFTNRKVKQGETYHYKIEVKYLDSHSEWTNVVQVKTP